MGSYVKQVPNDEAFWVSLVETNMRLGWDECFVPIANLHFADAKDLAARLEVRLEITSEGYIFRKNEPWVKPNQQMVLTN